MSYEITVEDVAPRTIACTWTVVAQNELGTAIGRELGVVWDWLQAHDEVERGHNIVVYLTSRRESGVLHFDCMFGVEVLNEAEPEGAVMLSKTPSGTVATTTHWGDYGRLSEAHDAIQAWCKANGRRTGAFWELYGDWSDDPAQVRTDVFYELL